MTKKNSLGSWRVHDPHIVSMVMDVQERKPDVIICCPRTPTNQRSLHTSSTVVYRSPNSNSVNNIKLNDIIRNIKNPTLTIGDMNYRGINWENGTSDS